MEVIINGIKYIPETDKTVEVGGIAYSNIGNWLSNIHYSLLREWMSYVKKGEGESQEAINLSDKANKFQEYTKEFLGFEFNSDKATFVEVKK